MDYFIVSQRAGSGVVDADVVGFVVSGHSLLWLVLLDVSQKIGRGEGGVGTRYWRGYWSEDWTL